MKKIMTYFMLLALLMTTVTTTVTVSNPVTVKAQSKRQAALIRNYNKIYRKCKKKFKYDGPQLEMNQESYKEFKMWDKELNRVYRLIYNGLSAKQKKTLKKKQIQWIKKKEKKAEKEAASWRGGSGEPLARNGVLITETKKRLRWLIRQYT